MPAPPPDAQPAETEGLAAAELALPGEASAAPKPGPRAAMPAPAPGAVPAPATTPSPGTADDAPEALPAPGPAGTMEAEAPPTPATATLAPSTPAGIIPKEAASTPPQPTPLHLAPEPTLLTGEFTPQATRAAEAPPPAPPQPPPAMRQVAPIAVALAFAPTGAGGFQLSLEPFELGRVEIRVHREGEAHAVRIIAERPETLALLLRDRQELDRGLADAGLRVEAKGIEFSLGTSSGEREQRPRDEARSGAAARGMGRMTGPALAEATPARIQRGLLDLNI